MPVSINGNTGITFPDGSVQPAAASPYVNKNRIINGDFRIDQRNAGASVTPASAAYTLDRWQYVSSQASKFTVQQNAASVTPPIGFTNYLGCTVTSAVTVGAGDYFFINQAIEGYNCADLAWGTANAKTITLSFQVYSSLTGTFGGVVRNNAGTRSYPFTYTISSANTWTTISVIVAGDTTGSWPTTNAGCIDVKFGLGVGSTYTTTAGAWAAGNYLSATGATSVVGTASATFYITGVQLEVGSSATPFERRLYGQELANCQRYAYAIDGSGVTRLPGAGLASSTTNGRCNIIHPVTMRAAPNLTVTNVGNYRVYDGSVQNAPTGSSIEASAPENSLINFSGTSGLTVGRCVEIYSNSTTKLLLSSEL